MKDAQRLIEFVTNKLNERGDQCWKESQKCAEARRYHNAADYQSRYLSLMHAIEIVRVAILEFDAEVLDKDIETNNSPTVPRKSFFK